MALWGTTDAAASVPLFAKDTVPDAANNTSLFGNTTIGNTVPNAAVGVFGVDAAESVAARGDGKGSVAPGWVRRQVGTGPVVSVTITDGGLGYANTDTISIASPGTGLANASATLSTNATGGITSITITNGGREFVSANSTVPTVTITTLGGSGANVTPVLGGQAGRVRHETLVAMKVSPTTDASDDTLFPDS